MNPPIQNNNPDMEITEEQRQRAERNRLAALAKRKAATAPMNNDRGMMGLFKCRKVSPPPELLPKFRVTLEICSPDSFSITPAPLPPNPYPGEAQCLKTILSWLSCVEPSHYTQNHGGQKASVYKLGDYDTVLKCLKKLQGIELEEIPWVTLNVVQKFSESFVANRWIPCLPEHLCDEDVDSLLRKMPKVLFDALLPFQHDGVRFGLQRGGCCLIADEMGLGKTIQAIAIASCFMNEGPILVVCPAILRYSWAEELERWLPILSPTDIHLVFGQKDNPSSLRRSPKIVVISYTMLHRLRKSILAQEWALLIVDESHHVRCTKKVSEPEEIKATLDVATKVKRKVLLSGTPSLSRPYDIFHQIDILWPGLLGKSKYEFAKTYCEAKYVYGSQGKVFQDFSKGVRLEELNVLLKQTVMIRRLKEHLLVQLPPKRRQIIRIQLMRSDINMAMAATAAADVSSMVNKEEVESSKASSTRKHDDDVFGIYENFSDPEDKCSSKTSRQLSYQELGIAKLSGFQKWLSFHPIITESDCGGHSDVDFVSHKMIIFAHHIKVLDRVQNFLCERDVKFVRIDGNTLARDRQSAVHEFRSSPEVKIAIIGITAGGVGVDFSSAQHVVFLEMPQSVSEMLQAEDRAHRRGQTNAVNIYIFCAKDTLDELRWPKLNKSLQRVSSVMNGKYDAVQEIAIGEVSVLGFEEGCDKSEISEGNHIEDTKAEEEDTKDEASEADSDIMIDTTICENRLQNEAGGKDLVGDMVKTTISGRGLKCCTTETQYIENREDFCMNKLETDEMLLEPDRDAKKFVEVNGADSSCLLTPDSLHSSCLLTQGGKDLVGDMVKTTISGRGLKCCTTETQYIENREDFCMNKLETDEMFLEPDRDAKKFVEVNGADSSCLLTPDSLRFEVSHLTGRVHLYACILGEDSTPRLLSENFHPEELESLNLLTVDKSKNVSQNLIKGNPAYSDVLRTFIREWSELRPIEQKKLFGKPLRCPLSLELCFLRETISHSTGGLLKGGSKRRVTPLSEINRPLPEDAVWKSITLCNSYGKKEKQYIQGWSVTGEPLCKLCQMPCKGKFAHAPEIFDHLFCQVSCLEIYRARTSQHFLRQELFKVEHGVCTVCNVDCHKLVQRLRPLSVAKRKMYIEKVAPKIAREKTLLDKLIKEPREGNAWHADHIVAVYRGGGECMVDNMRTLCVACHKEVTAAQAAERRLTRISANKQLKRTLRTLKENSIAEPINSNIEDDDLLVEVPGSAYSVSEQRSSPEVEAENKNVCSEKDSLRETTASGCEDRRSLSEQGRSLSESRANDNEHKRWSSDENVCSEPTVGGCKHESSSSKNTASAREDRNSLSQNTETKIEQKSSLVFMDS